MLQSSRRGGIALFELKPGSTLEYGLVRANYTENGELEVCDPYGCTRARILGSTRVGLQPVAPVHRPSRISNCIYLEFPEPLVVHSGTHIWAVVPFDLAVMTRSVVIGYVAPLRVKYTLIGDIVDGNICRYYRTRIAKEPAVLKLEPGEAVMEIMFRGEEASLSGVGFHIAGLQFYSDGSIIYYPRLEVVVSGQRAESKLSGRPNVEDLRPLGARMHLPRIPITQTFVTPLG
ncbi:DUF432 domain-containing protein [Hyperthermus butylicus]|uniref:DUF432 domain-containing protein n=1 Tax=Hyperthermus butylicus TaxID=54248 RepID=UPI001890CC54|nr:DUF432 domain-containing protein [Hyperthermus butylicus]